jgi:predicted outer membrane repeat protein
VLNTQDNGSGSLRAAIADAQPGDTIDFDPSLQGQTITLTSGTLTVNKNLLIQGPGDDLLTISSGGQFITPFTTSAQVTISGLTWGHSARTGVYNMSSGMLTLEGCTITDCRSGTGGGIFNEGQMTIDSCSITNNTAGNAGGVQNQGTEMTITNSVISGNHADGFGGGISNLLSQAHLTVRQSVISNNSVTTYRGGGIYSQGTVTLIDSTVANNSASEAGGGIDNWDTAILTITNCTISGNSAHRAGGINNRAATLTMTNSTVSGNKSTAGTGGGIDLDFAANVTIANSTIAGNSATGNGGGLNRFGGSTSLTLFDTIVAQNTSASGDLGSPMISRGHNLIGDGSGGSGYVPSDLVGTSGNPIDPLLGPLQDNGGPTQTMALLPGSPAVDAGDNTGAPNFDQRGLPRIVGGTIDIGAFEAQIGDAVAFSVQAPASVNSGSAFDVTVVALDAYGHVASGYTGTVTFTVTDQDPGVVIPDPYTFTSDDQGQHTFAGGFTLITVGDQVIQANGDGGQTGSATVTVQSGGYAPRPPGGEGGSGHSRMDAGGDGAFAEVAEQLAQRMGQGYPGF